MRRTLFLLSCTWLVALTAAPALAKNPARPATKEPTMRPAMATSAEVQATYRDIEAALGRVPTWLKEFPAAALPGFWEQQKALMVNPNTALSGKHKELIGLAVSAQIPCKYCIYYHTEAAKANGASETEVGEALAVAASSRHWSTWINGVRVSEQQFMSETDRIVTAAQKMAKDTAKTPPMDRPITDAASVYADMERMFGFVPAWAKGYPPDSLPGVWKQFKAVDMNPNTELSGKVKSLISLAVSAQVPCSFCTYWDTQFATKVEGATDKELKEAVAVASLVRLASTVLNGRQTDEAKFKTEMGQVFAFLKARAPSRPAGPAPEPVPSPSPRFDDDEYTPMTPRLKPERPMPGEQGTTPGGAGATETPQDEPAKAEKPEKKPAKKGKAKKADDKKGDETKPAGDTK